MLWSPRRGSSWGTRVPPLYEPPSDWRHDPAPHSQRGLRSRGGPDHACTVFGHEGPPAHGACSSAHRRHASRERCRRTDHSDPPTARCVERWRAWQPLPANPSHPRRSQRSPACSRRGAPPSKAARRCMHPLPAPRAQLACPRRPLQPPPHGTPSRGDPQRDPAAAAPLEDRGPARSPQRVLDQLLLHVVGDWPLRQLRRRQHQLLVDELATLEVVERC